MAKLKPIGATQRSVLECLLEHHGWEPGCGWKWDTTSNTEKILGSLAKRGLVLTRTTDTIRGVKKTRYTISDAGKEEVFAHSFYYRLKHGGKV